MGTVAPRAIITSMLVVTAAAPASAADQLLAGKKLTVKTSASQERLSFVLIDDAIVTPGPADSPTTQGATLRIVNPATG